MKERKDLLENFNQLLKGTHMGAFIFNDLRNKLKEKKHVLEFDRIIKQLKIHESVLTKYISELGGNPVDTAGLKGTIAEWICKFKIIRLSSDNEIIQEAVKSIENGSKALCDFDNNNYVLSNSIANELRTMKKDYENIYQILDKML